MPEPLDWARSVVSRFRFRLEPLAAWFTAQAAQKRLAEPLPGIVASLAHMHVNRMMLANPREHEMIVYAFLNRAYRSQIARSGG